METQSKAQPWRVERKELKSGLGDSLKIVGLFAEGDPRRVVATVNGKNNAAGANAYLLAAAPILLNACRAALRDEMSARLEAAGGLSDDTVAMLEAAIANTESWRR